MHNFYTLTVFFLSIGSAVVGHVADKPFLRGCAAACALIAFSALLMNTFTATPN